ncbi:MAG: MBL fold metallo-hydrolase [Puniceicoccales bacterium]|jgi:hypothetical protein|nr:MBL fold metallo-hydrolase [Puniceicoccales bacterium]
MKMISRLIFILAFSGCIICYGNGGSDSDSEEFLPQAFETLLKEQKDASVERPFLLPDGDGVSCFVLNVKQGNCVFLRGPSGTVVVDAGTQIPGRLSYLPKRNSSPKWDEFAEKYSDVIEYCFKDVSRVSFVITHLDIDHYSYIPFLARVAVEQGVKRLNFFIGVTNEQEMKDFSNHLWELQIPRQQCHFFGHHTPMRRSNASLLLMPEGPMFPSWNHFFLTKSGYPVGLVY